MYVFQVLETDNKYKIINVLNPNIALWVNLGKSISTNDTDLFDFIYDKLEEGYSLYIDKSKDFSKLSIVDIEVIKEEDLTQKINILNIKALEKLGEVLNLKTTETVTKYVTILMILIRYNYDESKLVETDRIKLIKFQKLYEAYDKYLEFYDKMLMASTSEELDQLFQNFVGELNEIFQQSSLLQV
jgi:hypothetical protein